uniref:Uncharacterized protein n=1 Tax=Trypanosoma vivax (strain Y486) TaxID=1055687 RepID=G0TZ32_TRYVY|nr:hypothetical protein TVY486_0705580 [Trypanosoma vivax Y486]
MPDVLYMAHVLALMTASFKGWGMYVAYRIFRGVRRSLTLTALPPLICLPSFVLILHHQVLFHAPAAVIAIVFSELALFVPSAHTDDCNVGIAHAFEGVLKSGKVKCGD